MNFQNPLILLFIPILLTIFLPLFIYSEKKNKKNLSIFIGTNREKLVPSFNKKIKSIKITLILLSLILLVITIARPQSGYIWQEQVTTGIDIVIAIDTSKSMEAIDTTPNRLSRAKLALLELSSELKGDRIALIPFAGSSFVMTPFTADYTIFDQSILALNTSTIPKGGTNLSSAITTAEELFKDKNSHKILILVTDGEDLANQGVDEAKRVAANGVQIFTIGVGTKDGELIPDMEKQGSYLKDKNGNIVKSRLDEVSLEKIADSTGGDYRHLSSGGNGIVQIYKEKLLELEQENKSEQRNRIPVDKYRWFLFPAILLLLLELLIFNIKGNNSRKKFLFSIIFLIPFSLFSTPADDALKSGDINKAIELYKTEKNTPEGKYNLGTAYYMAEDYDNAIATYKDGLSRASGTLQSKILYNLGNSYYRASEQSEEDKIELLKESLKSYEGSMALENKDERVEKNRDFVKKILEQLEQDNSDESEDQQDQQDNADASEDQLDQQDNADASEDQQDQQDNAEASDDQQDQQDNANASEAEEEMSAEEAEALLKALESEDVDIRYLLNDNDNSYSGEW